MSDQRTEHAASQGIGQPASLWASAFVLLALVITQAGRIDGGGARAYAGNVSTSEDLTVLTASGGDRQDNVIVLDRRAERIFVYGVENVRSGGVKLYESYDLKQVFRNARVSGGAPASGARP